MIYVVSGSGNGAGAILTVTAPTGSTITVTGNGKTYTKTGGTVEFKGLAEATYTVTATLNGQTATKTVTIDTSYETTLTYFSATIAVTYPAGSTLTCTLGSTVLTATTTTGSYTFDVPSAGDWVVSCNNGLSGDEYREASETVSITEDGQSASVQLLYIAVLFDGVPIENALTGGWISEGRSYSISPANGKNAPTITPKAADNSYPNGYYALTQNTGGGGVYRCVNKIDLTQYSTMKFLGKTNTNSGTSTGNVWCFLGTFTDFDGYTNQTAASKYSNSTIGEHLIDISSLNGEYYVGFQLYATSSKAEVGSLILE